MRFKLFVENEELPYSTANEQGIIFKTGLPVEFTYVKNIKQAPYLGNKYQQDIEPIGYYIVHNEEPGELPLNWIKEKIKFNNPLVIKFNFVDNVSYDQNNWKYLLYKKYNKIGQELSLALKNDGYDAVITTGQGNYTKEIVKL